MDALGAAFAPASLLLRLDGAHDTHPHHTLPSAADRLILLAIGRPGDVRTHPDAVRAHVADLPGTMLLPGLINPHTHLDLTHIGPRPFMQDSAPEAGFLGWVDMIRRERLTDPDAIAASVAQGVRLSRAGGVVAVGDIAGAVSGAPSTAAAHALRRSGMAGTSFIEFFALGSAWEHRVQNALGVHAQAVVESTGGSLRIGLQPHAPYSVLACAYERALSSAGQTGANSDRIKTYDISCVPSCTHLGETTAECELIARGCGPFVDFLQRLGLLDGVTRGEFGLGKSPVEHLGDVIARHGPTLVHLNHLTDRDIDVLASACKRFHGLTGRKICAVYCPRATAYFHPDPPLEHRWRDLRAAGLRVSLGTDSIVNLDTPDRLSPLDEARWVARTVRGEEERRALLGMITTEAAAVVGVAESSVTFSTPGQTLAGVVGVELGSAVVTAQSGWEKALLISAKPNLLLLGRRLMG
jgi:cytosine/adenosine deaminase-related metal-dependent hydrolase